MKRVTKHIQCSNVCISFFSINFVGTFFFNILLTSEENFLKKFSKDFYQRIITTTDFNAFEDTLSEWIKSIDMNSKTILELMQKNEFSFSSIIGFFYQVGINCDVDRNKALELYLLAENNGKKEFLDQNVIYFHNSKENDSEFSVLRNNNIIIGKYLLSLFYYKDIILYERKLIELNLKSGDDPVAQYKFGYCY